MRKMMMPHWQHQHDVKHGQTCPCLQARRAPAGALVLSHALRDDELAIRAPAHEEGDAERARAKLADLLVAVHGWAGTPGLPGTENLNLFHVS